MEYLSDSQPTQNEQKPKTEIDWKSYPLYQWFMETVGGPDRMIPKDHGLSWMLRIHHREITDAAGIEPEIPEKTASLIKKIDEFYNFEEGDEKDYVIGDQPT